MIRSVVALGVLAVATNHVHAFVPPDSDPGGGGQAVPIPAYAKAFAAGFDAVIADYYWIQAVQRIGGKTTNPSEHAGYLGPVIDLVTTLDPWVDHPYRFAAIWLTDSAADVRRGNALLRRGIEYHPREWRNYFYLGFNHFFYLGENQQAADALERASQISGSPRYLPRLVARLRSHTQDLAAAAEFLQQLVRHSHDPIQREAYQAALDEIQIEARARMIERARAAYLEVNGRDIERVEDLVQGQHPVLDRLPSAEPSSVPGNLGRGSVWKIQSESGRIVSSYYNRRYELHFHSADSALRERMRAQVNRNMQEEAIGDGA